MFLLSREHHTFEETFTFFHWRGEAGLKHCWAAHSMAQLWPLPGHPWTQGRDRTGHSFWNWGNSWVLAREQSFKGRDSAAWLAQIWLKTIILRLDTGVGSHIHTVESSPEGWEVPWDTCKIKQYFFLFPQFPVLPDLFELIFQLVCFSSFKWILRNIINHKSNPKGCH